MALPSITLYSMYAKMFYKKVFSTAMELKWTYRTRIGRKDEVRVFGLGGWSLTPEGWNESP